MGLQRATIPSQDLSETTGPDARRQRGQRGQTQRESAVHEDQPRTIAVREPERFERSRIHPRRDLLGRSEGSLHKGSEVRESPVLVVRRREPKVLKPSDRRAADRLQPRLAAFGPDRLKSLETLQESVQRLHAVCGSFPSHGVCPFPA